MLSANQQVLFNEIKKKQGRPIFALCRACGLAPADGAKAKLELIQLGVITEHNASSGLYLLYKNGLPEKPKAKPAPYENPFQVLRRNEPAKVTAEQNGFMTSEAKRQREEIARLEESERTEPAAYVMEKPKPIKEKSLAEQIAEELRWHEQFDREQEELEAEEQADEEFDRPETEQDREAIADFDREHAEPEPETESEEMANLSPTALAVLEKARANVNAEEEPAKVETPAPVDPVQRAKEQAARVVVPLTPGGKPMVNDEMIVEFLIDHGPATMATITKNFNRHGSGLATKLHKMVKNKIISERDRVPGSLVVYLTNADYLKEVGSTMPKQVLPVGAKPVNVERGSMLATREQTFTAKADDEIKVGTAVVSDGNGMVKVAEHTYFAPIGKPKEEIKMSPGVSVEEPPKALPPEIEIKATVTIHQYDIMETKEKEEYLRQRILTSMRDGPQSLKTLERVLVGVPGSDIREMLSLLSKRRRIIRTKAVDDGEGKTPAQWELLEKDSRESRMKRVISAEEIIALFPDAETILTTATIAEVFDRTASGLGVTLNALCKQRKLVKCGEAPARYRLPNATLNSILEEIENSFSVKSKEDLPDENWLPILNRLETLIGGNAGQVLADIQAYLKRRMKDD